MIDRRSLFALAKALEGVPILGTLPSSPAAMAGVRYGDVLMAVNGVRTKTMADYIAARVARDGGMDFVVFRGGAEVTGALEFDSGAPPPDMATMLESLVTLRVGVADEEPGEEPPVS